LNGRDTDNRLPQPELHEVLGEYQADYYTLTNYVTDIISHYTLTGRYVYVSPACYSLLGYSVAELLTYTIYDLIHPDDVAPIQAQQRDYLSQQTSVQLLQKTSLPTACLSTYRMRHKNGYYRWFETSSRVILTPSTTVTTAIDSADSAGIENLTYLWLAVSRDTHQRRQVEIALQFAHQQLLLILDNLPGIVYVADMKTYEILYVNHYAKHHLGDVVGKACWQAFDPQQTEPCQLCNQQTLINEQGQPVDTPQSWECYNQQLQHWYQVNDTAIHWIDGRLVHLQVAYDISARKQTEQLLRLNQQRYSLAVTASKTGVWDWDVAHNSLYLDDSLRKLLGYQKHELPDDIEKWQALIHPAELAKVQAYTRQYLRPSLPSQSLPTNLTLYELEYRMRHHDGHYHWMQVRGTALRNSKGYAIRLIGTHTDISERKLAEQQLREQTRLLNGIAQITHNLLTVSDDENAIHSALERLGRLLRVDRVYIFENHRARKSQTMLCSQRFAWLSGRILKFHSGLHKLSDLSYQTYLPGWYEKLNNHEPVTGLFYEFPAPTQALLKSQKVISLLTVPLHYNGTLWGFIGLDDCCNERSWSQYEIFVLKVIGDSIRGALARQQVRSSLRQSEAKFRTMIEANQDGLMIIDRNGIIRFVNPSAEAMYQAERDMLLDRNFGMPVGLDNKTEIEFIDFARNYHVGELHTSETQWDGEDVFIVSLRDITSRKQAEDALRQSEQRLNTVLDNVPVILFALDRDGIFTLVRGKGLSALGFHEGQLLNKCVYDLYRDMPQVLDNTRRALDGETFTSVVDFGKVVYEIRYSPLYDQHHRLDGTLGLAIDVTAHKKVEAALRQAKVEADKAREAAEAANRSKSEFLAAMSHEIRTPMNGVMGMAQLLLNTPLSDQQKHYVELINRSSHGLLTVINDILDFSKIEAGKLKLERVSFNLRQLLEEVTRLFATSAQRKGLEICCQLPSVFPEQVYGDPGRLRQVLNNLVGNAVKFTDEGEILIRLSVQDETETELFLLIEVIDTGTGMPLSVQLQLFQAFFQADRSPTREHGGTGLGLVIAKRLVEMMGGKIGVDSKLSYGSRFWFNLTVTKETHNPAAHHPAITVLHGIKVLVVDSHLNSQEVLLHALHTWDMLAIGVDSGEAALNALLNADAQNRPYQLCLCDYRLTDMSGVEFIHQVQTQLNNLSVILLGPLQHLLQPEVERQIAGFVHKPIVQAELLDCLLKSLAKPHVVDTTASVAAYKVAHNDQWQVLLAEDNIVNQEVGENMLRQLNCAVKVAANGLEVLDYLKKYHFDIIFMDCHMPLMDGFSASQQIRAYEAQQNLPHIPIIALTANAMQGDREACLNAGMDDYLTKPITRQRLIAVLDTWLKGQLAIVEKENSVGITENYQAAAKTTSAVLEPMPLTQEQPSESTPIDKKVLTALRQDTSAEGYNLLIDLFLRELPKYWQALQDALASGNSKAIQMAAHRLKGASINVGAQRVTHLSKNIEIAGKSGDLTDVNVHAEQLGTEIELIQTLLAEEKAAVE